MKEKEDSVPKMCSFYTHLKFPVHVNSLLGKAAERVRKGQKIHVSMWEPEDHMGYALCLAIPGVRWCPRQCCTVTHSPKSI